MDNRPGAVDDLQALYRESIRRHAAEPVGYRRPIEATHRHEGYNPLCGDRIDLALQIADGQVRAAAFDGEACAICMASASLLCAHAEGRPAARLQELAERLSLALGQRGEAGDDTELPAVLAPLQGVRPYPSRVRCATLPWEAAVSAMKKKPTGI